LARADCWPDDHRLVPGEASVERALRRHRRGVDRQGGQGIRRKVRSPAVIGSHRAPDEGRRELRGTDSHRRHVL
jgi:hypothetical protein